MVDVGKGMIFEDISAIIELVGVGKSAIAEELSVIIDAAFVVEAAAYVFVVSGASVAYTVVYSVTTTVL